MSKSIAHIEENCNFAAIKNGAWMMDIKWAELLGGAAMAQLIQAGYDWYKRKEAKKNGASKAIINQAAVQGALVAIPYHEVQRRVIFCAHNGGGRLNAKEPTYISVLYEDTHEPFFPIINDIQKWRPDAQYLEMLGSLVQKGVLRFHISDIPAGKMRDMYENAGAKYAELYYYGETEAKIYYGSFVSSNDIKHFGLSTRIALDIAINKIRNTLKFQ